MSVYEGVRGRVPRGLMQGVRAGQVRAQERKEEQQQPHSPEERVPGLWALGQNSPKTGFRGRMSLGTQQAKGLPKACWGEMKPPRTSPGTVTHGSHTKGQATARFQGQQSVPWPGQRHETNPKTVPRLLPHFPDGH